MYRLTTETNTKGAHLRASHHGNQSQSGLAAGVKGLSGSVTMDRSDEERQRHPDRINLDRKGLHGIPVFEDEPGLRLLSLQHNFVKRIQNVDSLCRLVFLDLYHNRIDVISNLEPLMNLRVLMLGKNRIRRIESLSRCSKLSVLDLHGNRITQISGLHGLAELKVLNLAGNLIRKIAGLDDLASLEELNVRRNRIRSTLGLEAVTTVEKLFIGFNEIQNLTSLHKIGTLSKLSTLQLEGNPVTSCPDYSHHLLTALPHLKVLDQQEISLEMRRLATQWKQSQSQQQPPPPSSTSSGASSNEARKQLLKKIEDRNVSISNAKRRWDFLKKQDWKANQENTMDDEGGSNDEKTPMLQTPSNEGDPRIKQSCSEANLQTLSSSKSSPLIASTVKGKLNVPNVKPVGMSDRYNSRSSPGSPSQSRCPSRFSGESESSKPLMFPPIISQRNEQIRRRFPGLERRRFTLPHKFINLQGQMNNEGSEGCRMDSVSASLARFASMENKIGFFHIYPLQEDTDGCSDEFSSNTIRSDSSSDDSSSDGEDCRSATSVQRDYIGMPNRKIHSTNDMEQRMPRNASVPKSFRNEMTATPKPSPQERIHSGRTKGLGASSKQIGSAAAGLNTISDSGGRTSEQGSDYLIELDGDLLSVYGLQSLKFLDRPWNKMRAMKATTVQFNFVAFDDLVPYLAKFRQTFPNVEHFEFLETDIHCLGQLNALSLVQGITSLYIGEDGNPIYHKNWKHYAIYRLEHWGLQMINNFDFTEDDILEANRAYGSLGELAIMVLPQPQIALLIKKLDLGSCVKDIHLDPSLSTAVDLLALIKDQAIKEIIAKEALQYKPRPPNADEEADAKTTAMLEDFIQTGHSALHKTARLESEWSSMLPSLIKRIMAQYSDIQKYKRDSLMKLERKKNLTTKDFGL